MVPEVAGSRPVFLPRFKAVGNYSLFHFISCKVFRIKTKTWVLTSDGIQYNCLFSTFGLIQKVRKKIKTSISLSVPILLRISFFEVKTTDVYKIAILRMKRCNANPHDEISTTRKIRVVTSLSARAICVTFWGKSDNRTKSKRIKNRKCFFIKT